MDSLKNTRGIILDLRRNPRLPDESLNMADAFLPRLVLAFTRIIADAARADSEEVWPRRMRPACGQADHHLVDRWHGVGRRIVTGAAHTDRALVSA